MGIVLRYFMAFTALARAGSFLAKSIAAQQGNQIVNSAGLALTLHLALLG